MASTITESYVLPSKGMIYDKPVDSKVTLRSMTTYEEMRRLSPTDTPYKVMCDIIESCMEEKLPIHVYDMSIGDYQFLLHKLRIVTYGPEYKMVVKCPKCEEVSESIADLETLTVNEYTDNVLNLKLITLPKTNDQIELNFQTPHNLDRITYLSSEMKKRTKQNVDYSLMYTIMSVIKKVNGQQLNEVLLEDYVKKLPAKDASYILAKSAQLNNSVGLDNKITVTCSSCGYKMIVPFRLTSEFYGPTID